MWSVAPMMKNLAWVLQRRGNVSIMSLLKYMLNKLHYDRTKTLQLATIVTELLKDDSVVINKILDPDRSVLLTMVGFDTTLDSLVTKNALTYNGYESSLLELNGIVQREMMGAVSNMYGCFVSPNLPILLNVTVLKLVQKYIELMPVHHAYILTMLNADKKVKDKSCFDFFSFPERLLNKL